MSNSKICLSCKYSRIDFDCGEPLEPTCWAPENTEISLITGELLQKGEPLCSTQRDPESSSIWCSKDGSWFQPIAPLELAEKRRSWEENLFKIFSAYGVNNASNR
jgi:hypothetical protein